MAVDGGALQVVLLVHFQVRVEHVAHHHEYDVFAATLQEEEGKGREEMREREEREERKRVPCG